MNLCWYCGQPGGTYTVAGEEITACADAHAYARAILHADIQREAEILRTLAWTANGSVFPTSADVEISEPPHPFTFTQHEGKPWPSSAER